MAISAYHVDSVINAYNRQNTVTTRQPLSPQETIRPKNQNVVSLSQHGDNKLEANKTSFASIIDLIMKDKGV